jgi:hypothetical protein
MYNHYHHGHFLIWQGITFPDGMVVLSGPEPGFFVDIMVWRDCLTRRHLERIMNARQAAGLLRYKLYADKIYNRSALVSPAWSFRGGPMWGWMVTQNYIMSKLRVSVEWTFGQILNVNKFTDMTTSQKIQLSPIPNIYTVHVLLNNCHCAKYGNQSSLYFDVEPPSLHDYLVRQ